jgi:protein phosphatase
LFVEGETLHFGHIGDSRAYFVGEEKLEQITTDHTLVEQLILNGTLAREDAGKHPNRNVITRAVGVDKSLEIDYFTRNKEQERLLLCSDGLTDSLNDDEIFEIVKNSETLADAVQSLVAHSNQKGGHDNITVVLIEFSEKVREVEA